MDKIKNVIKELTTHQGTIRPFNINLQWNDPNDLDLYVITPVGTKIFYSAKQCSQTRGCLDIDMNAGVMNAYNPIEHVYFNKPLVPGTYTYWVNYCSQKSYNGVQGGSVSKYTLSVMTNTGDIL